ncbi:hypothetical protein Scep_012858 [Stephania cephalantha]|uniref:Integrase catalytic domain-containing protein n=1 Tax=Stephania cephalantha TaxID=152367 RepID=A0AAP0P9Y9_9MAGN
MDSETKKALLQGKLEHGLYKVGDGGLCKLSALASSPTSSTCLLHSCNSNKSSLWHCRLGHPSISIVNKVLSSCRLPYEVNSHVCSVCQMAKSHRLPFALSESRASAPLHLVHSDCAPQAGINGARYFALFVDDFYRFSWLYLLHSKDQLLSAFIQFKTMAEKQLESPIKILQTDGGGEFQAVDNLLTAHGIIHRVSCPYTSQQNGRVERKHRHVVETGLPLLAQSSMHMVFWPFAFQSVVYLINRLPTSTLANISPYEILYKQVPQYNLLRVFGCACFPCLRPFNANKLAYRSALSTFLGYDTKYKGYLCLNMQT